MKKIVLFSLIIGIIFLANISAAAISVSVSPPSAPANTATGFTFGTQAASAGGSVQFKIFNDFNKNGTIDANEWPMLNMVLTDNGQGWNGEEYLAADSNSSSPNITTVWNLSKCNAAYLPVGNYIIQVKNEFSEIATAQFSVTPAFAPQTVTGTVFEEGTSNPIQNALCDCEYINEEDNLVSFAFTDSNGSYTLQIPAPGNVDIDCYKYGYTEDDALPLSVPVGGITNFNLNLKPADAQITGIVTDSGTGNFVWGAEIWAEVLSDGENETWTTTNIDGSFTLPVLTGGVEIGVEKYGYMDTANNLNVPAVGVTSHNISLVPATTQITGIVRESGTGAPICGAEVWVDTDEGDSWNETGADGSFILPVTHGERKICVEKGGYMPVCPDLTVPVGGISGFNLSLQPLDTQITGTITEFGTGNPISGGELAANTIDWIWIETISDNNGNYILPALSGVEWSVNLYRVPGYFGMEPQHIKITPTVSGHNIVDFTAHKETAWIEGTLLDEYGNKPVEGAFFELFRTNPAPSLFNSGITDSSGQVTVGLGAGDWSVGVGTGNVPVMYVDGIPREMVRQRRQNIINITIGEHRAVTSNMYYADGAIEGRVFRQDGVTPAPEGVVIFAQTQNALNDPGQTSVGYIDEFTITDANGYYRLPLLGGTWDIRANMWNWNKQSSIQQVTLTTDGNDVINQPGEVITGVNFILDLDIFNPNPIPDIKANGSDGPVGINTNDNLSVTVALDPVSHSGENADWWVAADTPYGWFYLVASTMLWEFAGTSHTDLLITHQGTLFNLSTIEVLNIPAAGLLPGTYTLYFAVDTNMNGSLDFDSLYYDSVVVNITP